MEIICILDNFPKKIIIYDNKVGNDVLIEMIVLMECWGDNYVNISIVYWELRKQTLS